MVLDHLLQSVRPQSVEWVRTSFEPSLAEFYGYGNLYFAPVSKSDRSGSVMLKFTFMLFKPCQISSSWWMEALSSWQTAFVNVWIMGPTECCTTILLGKPSQTLSCVSLLEPGILDCRHPWVFSKCKLFLKHGTTWRTTHLNISCTRFKLSDVQVLWS
jgi:hypothetical protein